MNLFTNLKERAKSFISGKSSFRIQDKISARVLSLSGIIPKKGIPKQLIDRISRPLGQESKSDDPDLILPKKVTSSLGNLTLDLIRVNNNLEKIADIIKEDYKSSKELNKKETEDYRKRIANRFRSLGKKDYKSNKVDISNLVKNFAGSFFKGVGGALRALAAFNFLESLMRGDSMGAISALLGMAGTYIPAIVGGVVGGITSSIFGGIKNLFKGGKPVKVPTSTPTTSAKPTGPQKMPGMGKFGKMLALGTSAFALASALNSGKGEEDESQTRLEQLTQEQKDSLDPEKIVPIPQDDLKRFEELNRKFEKAIDFLLGKQKESDSTRASTGGGGGGGGGGGSAPPPPATGAISGSQAQIESQMFDYLKTNYGENVAYGMLSNAMRESGYRTNAPESGFQGMFQWDSSRWANLTNWARSQGLDPMDRGTQLRFALKESEDLGTLRRMRSARTPEEAASIFYNEFERGSESKPIKGSSYDPNNIHEQKNRNYIRDIRSRQSRRSRGTIPNTPPSPPNLNSVLPPPVEETLTVGPNNRIERRTQPRPVPGPISKAPQVIPVPITPPSPQSPTAMSVDEIDIIPSFETSYEENFLTVYSKLIYQVV